MPISKAAAPPVPPPRPAPLAEGPKNPARFNGRAAAVQNPPLVAPRPRPRRAAPSAASAPVHQNWVEAKAQRTAMMGVIDRLQGEGKKVGIILIDITGCLGKAGTDAGGDMRRVMGLLDYAKQKDVPIFHVETQGVDRVTPPNMRGYPHYRAANKKMNLAHFSVYPAIREALAEQGVGPVILAGSKRGQCVLNTATGEPVRRGAKDIKPGTAANQEHDVYVADMYAIGNPGKPESMASYHRPGVTIVPTPRPRSSPAG